MKLCLCGGRFARHGSNQTNQGGERYQCRECDATITVRNGEAVGVVRYQTVLWVSLGNPKRPEVRDWRHV